MNTAALLGLCGVALLTATTTVWFLRASRVDIPDNRLLFLLGWAGGGVLGAASFASPGLTWVSGLLAGLSLLGSLFLLGLYVLRKQGVGNPILTGDVVPAFEALDEQRRTYKSEELLGTPTLLKFFRGHW